MANAMAASPQEGRSRLMIGGAVVFAAIFAILLFVALQNSSGGDGTTSTAITTDVVVAARNVDVNTTITADMLEVRSVSVDEALSGAYDSIDGVIGLPARYPLQQGEQITTAKVGLQAIEDEKDLALVLDAGMRGFAIDATEVSAVGGLLLPGNYVDVIAVERDEDGNLLTSRTVLQNVEVLGVAQEAQEPVPASATGAGDDPNAGTGILGQRPEDVERQPQARSVTLAVTPEQAQLLAAFLSGDDVDLWLSLRPVDDDGQVSISETLLPEGQ